MKFSTNGNIEEMDINLKDVIPGLFGPRTKKRNMRVSEALEYLVQEEEQKLVDMDQVTRIALERVERNGIIFLDEIDKIAGREGGHGPDVSREGVQRDILPDRRRNHGQYAPRLRAHGSYSVRCRRRLPRLETG